MAANDEALYPTKSRLALLGAVRADEVIDGLTDETIGHVWLTTRDGEPPRKVCARVEEAERAGWVEVAENLASWRLTKTGERILREYGEG